MLFSKAQQDIRIDGQHASINLRSVALLQVATLGLCCVTGADCFGQMRQHAKSSTCFVIACMAQMLANRIKHKAPNRGEEENREVKVVANLEVNLLCFQELLAPVFIGL